MTENPHPRFPNPTIVEALCEIHFGLSSEHPWRSSLAAELFFLVRNEYPEMELIQAPGFRVDIARQRLLPPQPRVSFKSLEEDRVIQLSESTLTINILAPYPGWQEVIRITVDVWEKSLGVIKPQSITRIGLRYINRISYTSEDNTPASWLKATNNIPASVIMSAPGFVSRVETRPAEDEKIIVTVSDEQPSDEVATAALLLDVDRIVERQMNTDTHTLLQEMNKLHEDIWVQFAEAKTERFTSLLEGVK